MTAPPALVTGIREAGCGKLRRLLDSYLSGELSVETNHEVLEHLERCPACRAESEARERLKAQLRRVASALTSEPSPGFETRLRAALSQTPPRRSLPVAPLLLLAASLAAAAGLAMVLLSGARAPQPPAPIAHRRPAPGPGPSGSAAAAYHVAAGTQLLCTLHFEWPNRPPSLELLRKRLPERFHGALRSVAGALGTPAGYEVMAAHECSHGERPVLHFILRRQGERDSGAYVSVIAFAKGDGSLAGDAPLAEEHVRSDQGDRAVLLTGGRREGFDIVGTENAGYLIFLVGSRGASESIALGRRLLPVLAITLV